MEQYTIEAPDTGKQVRVFPSLLDESEVSTLKDIVEKLVIQKNCNQFIIEEKNHALVIRSMLRSKGINMNFKNFITVSHNNTPIPIHVDLQDVCPFAYKVLIYLSEMPPGHGGTIFYKEDETPFATIPNSEGTVVIFDSKLKHASQSFPKEYVKISIGIRAS